MTKKLAKKPPPSDDRQTRLAQKLRENLRRRKGKKIDKNLAGLCESYKSDSIGINNYAYDDLEAQNGQAKFSN